MQDHQSPPQQNFTPQDNDPSMGTLPVEFPDKSDEQALHQQRETAKEEAKMSPSERAAVALERSSGKGYRFRDLKLHGLSKTHRSLWEDICSDGRGTVFRVSALIFVLQYSPNRVVKLNGQNLSVLRQAVAELIQMYGIDAAILAKEFDETCDQIFDDAEACEVALDSSQSGESGNS